MLRLRQNELVDFEHYLQVRQPTPIKKTRRGLFRSGFGIAGVSALSLALAHANIDFIGLSTLGTAVLGYFSWAEPKRYPTTPDQELRLRADYSAAVFQHQLQGRKLRGSLHSGMAALLNECAQSWRRILAVNQSRVWRESDRASYWNVSQQDWTRVADLAMAEALVLGEASVTFKGPRSRAEQVMEEVLGALTIVGDEHLPPQFAELREITDNLRTLATEVESISETLKAETKESGASTANRKLEEVLGQMRSIRTAEEELRHHTT